MFKKQLENKLNTLQQILPEGNGQVSFELEFVSNFQVRGERTNKLVVMSISSTRLRLSSRLFKPA